MKILVDKMPNSPKDCLFSRYTENGKGNTYYACTRGSIVCPIPNRACPYFTDAKKPKGISDKLKPCPFCGGNANITHENEGTDNSSYVIECEDCGAFVTFVNSSENGEEAWHCSKAATINSCNFIVTAICPASTGDDGLMFDRNNASIIKKSNTDLLISRTPIDGFLYPVFSDRHPDVNSVLVYTKSPKKPNISMVEDVLDCNFTMSCQSEKETFIKILYEVLGDDLSYSLVTQINEKLSEIAANYKNETKLPRLTPNGLVHILSEIWY